MDHTSRNPGPRDVELLGVGIDSLTVEDLHAHLDALIEGGGPARILNVNAHCMNLCHEHPWLRKLLNGSAVVFCDGAGVRLAAWLTGQHLAARITYADWLPQLAAHCAARGHSLYLLGGAPGVAEGAGDRLLAENPELILAGTHHGAFGKRPGSPENEAVLSRIREADPDVLLIAFGMPLQERWLLENQEALGVPVSLTGGAALDYASGQIPRGPPWLIRTGFEWLARLLHEPSRLWRRYLIGNPLFLWRVLLWHGLGRRA